MCASVGRSLDNNNTIGLLGAFHGLQRRFREHTCKVVVVENHVTHRVSSSFHSTLTKTPSSPIAPAEKNVWHRHCLRPFSSVRGRPGPESMAAGNIVCVPS